jgi:hypothetical protein
MADGPPEELAGAQRWMQHAMLCQHGPPETTGDWVTGSSRLGPQERFAVYWWGYRLRLLEAMRGLYPALCHLLGQQLFDGFVLDYLDTHPSRSPTLFRLGDRFAAHLARTRPDPDRDGAHRESWPDLLVDLAEFERVFAEVLDGPGPEERPSPDTSVPGEARWTDVRLAPAEWLRLVAARFPVHQYVTEVHRGGNPAPPAPRPTYLAVHRRDYHVLTRELSPAQYQALRTLVTGGTVATALGTADRPVGAAWLSDWASSGFFTARSHPPPSGPQPVQRTPNS